MIIFFKFISFCLFFNKQTGDYPNVKQKEMFYASEKGVRNSFKFYSRNEGPMEFCRNYALWVSKKNPDKKIIYLTNRYGVNKLNGKAETLSYSNLIVINSDKVKQTDSVRGLRCDLLIVDNENTADEVFTTLVVSNPEKIVGFFAS